MLKEKLVWYAPTWSTAPKQWWALKKYVLSPGPIARITIASLLAVVLVVAGFKIAFPAIVIPNLLPLLFAFPVLFGQLTLTTYLNTVFKACVTVDRKNISITHGQSGTRIKLESLTNVILSVHDGGKARIRFCYQRRGKTRFKTFGIPNDVDLNVLEDLIPLDIVARDCRRQQRTRQQ